MCNDLFYLVLSIRNETFCGDDTIRVSTMNKNGENDLDVPIFVEPMNDPPFINVPHLIVLENKKDEDGMLIFDIEKDKFDFFVGDPDLLNFPGIFYACLLADYLGVYYFK